MNVLSIVKNTSFADISLEEQFRDEQLPTYLLAIRFAGLLVMLGFLGTLVLGLLGGSSTERWVHYYRVCLMLFGFVVLFQNKFLPNNWLKFPQIYGLILLVAVVSGPLILTFGEGKEFVPMRLLGASLLVALIASLILRGSPAYLMCGMGYVNVVWVAMILKGRITGELLFPGYLYVFLGTISAYAIAMNIAQRERALFLERLRAKELQRQAEDATHAKTYFYSAASHDLRQPLAAMGLWVEQLDRAKSLEDAKTIGRSLKPAVTSMKEMFDSLMVSSSLEEGKYEIDPTTFNLKELIEGIANEYRDRAGLKGIELRVQTQGDAFVKTDWIYMTRLVKNLLHNAVTYTSQGYVTVGYRKAPNEQIEVFVSDTGPGIPKTLHDRIFDEYFQVDNPQRDRSKGLGLGLSIVRRISNALDLGLQLESDVGKGSRFSVRLPMVS